MRQIPVRLSFNPDIIGYLHVPDEFAAEMASVYQYGLTFRLDGAILIKDNHATLMEVSIIPLCRRCPNPFK